MYYIEKCFNNGVTLTLVDIDYQEEGDQPIWRQYNGHLPSTIVKTALTFENKDDTWETIHHLKLTEFNKPVNNRSGKVFICWYDPNGEYEPCDEYGGDDDPLLDYSYYKGSYD
jgi:hypothetical protein